MVEVFGNVADWVSAISAVAGTVIALRVLIFVRDTYKLQNKQIDQQNTQISIQNDQLDLQRKQLDSQEKELKATREHLIKQQFETVFYKMLDTIFTIGKDIKDSARHDFFVEFINRMKVSFNDIYKHEVTGKSDYEVIKLIDKREKIYSESQRHAAFDKLQNSSGRLNNDQKKTFLAWVANSNDSLEMILDSIYFHHFMETDSLLGHFFRYIVYTIEFVEREISYVDPKRTDEEREKYIKLIQAQLSNNQLVVMFYNCLCHVSYDSDYKPEAKKLMERYSLFKNLLPEMLIRGDHQDLYNIDFKFPYK